MRKTNILIIITMGFFSALFSCKKVDNSKAKNLSTNEFVNHDKRNKIVRQNIFDEVTVFTYQDFEDLQSNKKYDKFEIGELQVTSGKIVCTDPMYRALGFPQNWKVPIGQYPVNIYIKLDDDFGGRVAYSEITFSSEEIESWELSLIDENLLKGDIEKKINGLYPVENGLSSFSDFETWKKYDKYVSQYQKKGGKSNFYADKLEPLFKSNDGIPKSSRGEDWANYKMDDGNIIMFGSGWGDGLYARYVGFGKKGNPIKLITDFIRLSDIEE